METYLTREDHIRNICSNEPAYRVRQIVDALFSPSISGWEQATSLSKALREKLVQEVPWNTLRSHIVLSGKKNDTWKALLEAKDGARIESVMMRNSRGHLTVCVSTQVGCAMACRFCATGKMGFSRNLSADEIVDQVRFFREYLVRFPNIGGDITNVVYMGMGEPLANYENVCVSLRMLIDRMGIGPTRITVSTVGLVPMLKKLLADPEWPSVRLAVSLHSADPHTRKDIMPTSYADFLEKLGEWTKQYFQAFSEKRRHLTFEYILLSGVNDTEKHIHALIRFARRVGKVRINLIPYNYSDSNFKKPPEEAVEQFQSKLKTAGIIVTRRRTMGDDIAAACGQLANKG